VGMTAVGEVIANRARIRRMTPGMAAQEPCRFSPLNRVRPATLIMRFEKMPLYQEALRIAKTVMPRTPSPSNCDSRSSRGAKLRSHKAAIKPHTLLTLRGNFPAVVSPRARFTM